MEYSTPISWMFDRNIVVAHDSTVCLWDVEAQRSYPPMTFPTVLGIVKQWIWRIQGSKV